MLTDLGENLLLAIKKIQQREETKLEQEAEAWAKKRLAEIMQELKHENSMGKEVYLLPANGHDISAINKRRLQAFWRLLGVDMEKADRYGARASQSKRTDHTWELGISLPALQNLLLSSKRKEENS